MSAPTVQPEADVITLTPLKPGIAATVAIPGSKSYTIRALILAAMAEKPEGQPVRVWNPLQSDDGQAVIHCLNRLGIRTDWGEAEGRTYLDVSDNVQAIADADYTLHTDLSAATLRFLLALSAVIPGRQTLLGHEGLNRRPVKDLVDALRALGVEIDYLEREGYPPVRVNSSQLKAEQITVSGATSSQYISALLIIAPLIETVGPALEIVLPEAPVSQPYLEMTLAIMQAFGVQASHEAYQRFSVPTGQQYETPSYTVEPDASSAAYFAAIATLTHSKITLKNLNSDSVQADIRFIEILKQMGTRVEAQNGDLIIEGHGVKPLNVNMCDCPDQAQALAVLAAFANGVTRIEGLQSLRVKETDRIAAVETELRKMGIPVEAEADALVIHGGKPQAARISTYGDHRMAMAFAVAGAVLNGLQIENPTVVNKTYPGFWQDLNVLGMGVQRTTPSASSTPHPKIVLIGFMGAGKSSVGKLLAEQLGLDFIEMDERIVQQSGRASVAEIFDQDGETHFRKLEAQVAASLKNVSNAVISPGGGVISQPSVMADLKQSATVVWLDTQWETVQQRLNGNQDRPLLREPEKAKALYVERFALYQNAADLSVETDGQTPQAITAQILQALGREPIHPQSMCTV